MKHDYVYFYKLAKNNIPVLTGGSTDLNNILFPSEQLKKDIFSLVPSKDNLYVLVDNYVFKLI
ncbi:hypothetical protein C5Z25_01690 [Lactobacillus sp. CBA3605]|nr:hypothetical protein C5Z25_01690 [Lactobacillus sp. CBA3605]